MDGKDLQSELAHNSQKRPSFLRRQESIDFNL
jgi:hypothetical protein